jgi:hypothetical protein
VLKVTKGKWGNPGFGESLIRTEKKKTCYSLQSLQTVYYNLHRL